MQTKEKASITNHGPMWVRRCKCGGIQIQLGAVSFKLDEQAAQFLFDNLGETLGAPKPMAPHLISWLPSTEKC